MNSKNENNNLRLLGLDKELNPEFHQIISEHNSISEEWDRINLILNKLQQPTFWLFGHKKKLKKYGVELHNLQKKFIKWNKRSGELLYKPDLKFSQKQESELGFLHYTNVLRDLRNKMDRRMVIIADNYNRKYEEHQVQVNFLIAIISFFLTFIGLIATLITLI